MVVKFVGIAAVYNILSPVTGGVTLVILEF
jgi:hypothetical protein